MTNDVIIAPRAKRELREIGSLFGRTSARTAFLDRFDKALAGLAKNAYRGRPRDDLEQGLRSVSLGPFPYAVFYVVENDVVQVVRVVDTRRDLQRMFR